MLWAPASGLSCSRGEPHGGGSIETTCHAKTLRAWRAAKMIQAARPRAQGAAAPAAVPPEEGSFSCSAGSTRLWIGVGISTAH